MSTQILSEIKALSLTEKVDLMEFLFKEIKEESIKIDEVDRKREDAVEALLENYQNDKELTAFTSL